MIKEGIKVVDNEGIVGIVKDASDPHNIFVKYTSHKGSGFYCIVEGCDEYDPVDEQM